MREFFMSQSFRMYHVGFSCLFLYLYVLSVTSHVNEKMHIILQFIGLVHIYQELIKYWELGYLNIFNVIDAIKMLSFVFCLCIKQVNYIYF